MRYDITVLGNHQSTMALVESLIRDDLKPDLIVTLSREARARVNIAGASSDLAEFARGSGIAVHECEGYRLVAERDRAFFQENLFGIGVCTDWQHLIPGHVLDAFEQGVFGFHGSLMAFPNGRGRSPFNWSIRLGGKSVLHNCFRYTEGADEGGVFNTTEIPIAPEEPIRTLQFKALVDSRVTIRRLLRAYHAGAIELTPQPRSAGVWLPKLTPADSLLEFEAMGIEMVLNLIRASSRPFAGAYGVTDGGKQVTLWRAGRYDGPLDPQWEDAAPGTVVAAALDSALIKCRDGLLLATEISIDADRLVGVRFS